MNQALRFFCLCIILFFATAPADLQASGTVTSSAEWELDNALFGGGTVNFSTDVTIVITGPKPISSNTTIDGTGHSVVISGQSLYRIFEVNSGVTLTLKNVTLTNGKNKGSNGSNGANAGPGFFDFPDDGNDGDTGYGGAIYNVGTLVATDCTFTANSAVGGNGGNGGSGLTYDFVGGKGGAAGSGVGGAIYSGGTSVTLTRCTFYNNWTQGGNGGRGGNGGSANGGRDGGDGGAGRDGAGASLYVIAGSLNFTNCTFSGESTTRGLGGSGGSAGGSFGDAGGSGSNGSSFGGSLTTTSSATGGTIVNCTYSGNAADTAGAIYKGAGTITLKNTILKTGSRGANAAGTLTDGGNNISNDASCAFGGSSFNSTDPKISSLALNGGVTGTCALQSGSPAINTGNDSTAPVTDQRNYYRQDRADIGAYEANGIQFPIVSISPSGPVASEDGDAGIFRVGRVGGIQSPLTVSFTISGTAVNGTDYATITTNVTIPALAYDNEVVIQPISDGSSDDGETVTLTLQTNSAFVLDSEFNTATIKIYEKSKNDPTLRFFRGSGTDSSFHSFVVPLSFQSGIRLSNTGGNLSTFFPSVFSGPNYHYNVTNPATTTNLSARISFDGPIAAFGSRVGGSALFTGTQYKFGGYSGYLLFSTNAFRLRTWTRSGGSFTYNGAVTVNLPLPQDTNAWLQFQTNGFTYRLTTNGLTTILSLPNPNLYSQWGAAFGGPMTITHEADSSSTNKVYSIELAGYIRGYPVVDDASSHQTYSPLYTVEFDNRPTWRSTFIDQPQFSGEPLPPFYIGKSLDEILSTNVVNTTISSLTQGATTYTNLDQSPELRRHPILDQFVQDMRRDPIALAGYVQNEIAVTDALSYKNDGNTSDVSLNPPGVTRSALATYLEGQGSPIEQCALLVYLLR